MPIYRYKCSKCEYDFEEIIPINERGRAQVCPECEGVATRQINVSSFSLKGGGWYRDGYASKRDDADGKKVANETRKKLINQTKNQ